MSETMCNTLGCVYVRVNIPSDVDGSLAMAGFHMHPEPDSVVTADLVEGMFHEGFEGFVPSLREEFARLDALQVEAVLDSTDI